jgi:hypothetical protein
MATTRDTGPLGSKKFLAYFVAELTSKALLAAGLFILKDHLGEQAIWAWSWMMTLTICSVFLEVGAILGIAYVDKFVRVAQVMADRFPGASPSKSEEAGLPEVSPDEEPIGPDSPTKP